MDFTNSPPPPKQISLDQDSSSISGTLIQLPLQSLGVPVEKKIFFQNIAIVASQH